MKALDISVLPFSLEHTLRCGQFFRFKQEPDGSYAVVSGCDALVIRQEQDTLRYSGLDEKKLVHLFSLDDDLPKIYQSISKDNMMRAAVAQFKGLRVMRQSPFECLISYICSANSNIPMITRMVESIACRFGEPVSLEGKTFYSFPSSDTIAGAPLDALKACKVGFRAKYIKEAAEHEPDWDLLKKLNYEEARDELIKLKGVGPKVADCVCLFALHKLESFPIDVWMARAMQQHYGFKGKKAHEFARQYFGKYAGYAQEYIFAHVRAHAPSRRTV